MQQKPKVPRDGIETSLTPCSIRGPKRATVSAMHLLHRKAAEQHELAAQFHRTAAEHNEKGDNETGKWHEQRALEYADRAHELAVEAHNKSGRIGTL
jgi:hypothetical protein